MAAIPQGYLTVYMIDVWNKYIHYISQLNLSLREIYKEHSLQIDWNSEASEKIVKKVAFNQMFFFYLLMKKKCLQKSEHGNKDFSYKAITNII